MIYKGIETLDIFIDMHWYTYFMIDGEVIHTTQWFGFWGENDVRRIIDEDVLKN